MLVAFFGYAAAKPRPTSASFGSTSSVFLADGSVAPTFRLSRLGGGAPVDLASTRGKPTVVSFFASWCANFRSVASALGAASASSSSSVNFVGVDVDDNSPALAMNELAASNATFPIALDPSGKVANGSYLVSDLPVTYYLDAQGRVVGESSGALTVAEVESRVESLESGGQGAQ